MINRGDYIDNYGLQVDPLFDRIDFLENALKEIADMHIESHEDAAVMADIAMGALSTNSLDYKGFKK